jgi:beta-mannanase
MLRSRAAAAAVYAMLLAAVGVFVALQIGVIGIHGNGSAPAPLPWPIPPPASATIDIGATTAALARNPWRPWTQKDLESVNALEQAIHKHVSVVMWYADWAHRDPLRRQLEAVGARGSIPEITWEPWNALHAVRTQPYYRLRNIVAGRFDGYIRSWAKTIAAYGKPVLLRFAQEMNGAWYPWSEQSNGNRRGDYVRAWDHIQRIFDAVGATNVRWVWSVASVPVARELYPGRSAVDIVSLTIFNGGSQLRYTRWQSFGDLVAATVERLRGIVAGKPIEISEVGCAEQGGDKPAWISGLFSRLRQQPEIKSVVWFDLTKWSDWRIESSTGSIEAFRRGVADPRYR